ncbi:MAG: alpha/beta fold hydrolase [Oscillospiraceae bacterium]|jgi:pimeloyl-ACP methyl ester carboxylesterase|nr:alpha/beta fold hydrolase [Oscillospiraceae bacterium]
MIENQLQLLQSLALHSKEFENFCKLNDLDEMYVCPKKLVDNLSEEDSLNVAGKKSPLTSKLLASLISLSSITFNNGFVSAETNSKSGVFSKISSTVSNKYDDLKNRVSDNPKTVKNTLIVETTALAATAAIASAFIYKNSDNFFQRHVIGDTNLRGNGYSVSELPSNIRSEPVNINNKLRGFIYSGNGVGALSGKYVIFYSGSGSPNAEQVKNAVVEYIRRGASVVGVDYSGFGSSGEAIASGKIRQSGIYSDAQEIYNYIERNLRIRKSNIILHGYSLGGAAAAHVAANVSQGQNKLGGLILQSSIKNVSNAAYDCLKNRNPAIRLLVTLGGYLFADQFDCEKELKRLFKNDSSIPFAVCAGDSLDGLRLNQTKLSDFARETGFKNLKVHSGNEGHMKNGGAPIENFDIPNVR